MNKREAKRNELANNVAKEVRYQFSTFGSIVETDTLYQHLVKWMEYTGKDKYSRPKPIDKGLPF